MALIALHVNNATALTAGDTAVRNRMRDTLGHTVDVFNDLDAQQSGYDAIVIAESCSSGDMAGKYLDTATPVMVSEGALWDDFGLASTASSTSQTDDQWNVSAGTAISGGLSGTQTVFSSNQPAHNATDRASASTLVAVLTNATTRATVFYLNQGDARAGGGAAVEGKRVAFGLADAAASSAQASLWTLFDAAIDWMVGGVTPPTDPPGAVFDLSRFHLTLPSEDPGPDTDAAQIDQPELATYSDVNFFLDSSLRMVCIAPVNGFTTSGASGATRMELRERNADYSEAAWDPATTDLRRLTITTQVIAEPITGGTDPREEMIIYQIHGDTGTPPMYLAAEYHVATPRIRLYMGNRVDATTPFRDNPVPGPITADTFITIRTEVELGELRIWVVAGQVADLAATPNYTFVTSELSDKLNWYYKAGAYNKTEITSGSTGQVVAKISHLELIQPGDTNPPLTNTTRFFLTG